MIMMESILNKKINEMKNLRQREERRDNKAAQEAADSRYKNATEQTHAFILALAYTKNNMQFQLNDALIDELQKVIELEKSAIQSGYADKEIIGQVESAHKALILSVKKEWSKQYKVLTDSTISTLKVISGIDSESVSQCLDGIAKGESWTTDVAEFKTMENSLASAKNLIDGLGLDQQIILFLQKMNSGKATIVDLSDNVLNWLRKESLDKRVRLSFSNLSRK